MREYININKSSIDASKGHKRRRGNNVSDSRSMKRCGCITMSVSALAVAAVSCVSVEAFVIVSNKSHLSSVLPARHASHHVDDNDDHHFRSLPPTMSLSME